MSLLEKEFRQLVMAAVAERTAARPDRMTISSLAAGWHHRCFQSERKQEVLS